MIQRVNLTGRRRLTGREVAISLEEGPPRAFQAVLDLTGLNVPGQAQIYIEAYSRAGFQFQRFDFGTADNPGPTVPTILSGVTSDLLLFRVKVVDRTDHCGRLLAVADRIVAQQADSTTDQNDSLLPVKYDDHLGELVWRLTFDDSGPVLELNRQVVSKDHASNDAVFRALVYPAVLEAILRRAATLGQDLDADWAEPWLQYGSQMARRAPPVSGDHDDPDAELETWVAEAVAGFTRAHRLAGAASKVWGTAQR